MKKICFLFKLWVINFLTAMNFLFFPLLLITMSGMANGFMDTLDHHWKISIFYDLPDFWFREWLRGHYFDIEGTWYSYLGITYMAEDGWHFGKGLTGIFALGSFVSSMIASLDTTIYSYLRVKYLKSPNRVYYILFGYALILVLFWWAGKTITYDWLLLK